MSWIKPGLLILLIVMLIIQFIQPTRNLDNGQVLSVALTEVVDVPQNVQAILQTSCYNCHSNNTLYPWYSRIQPVSWWMASHIKKGKEELNFSEFGNYSNRMRESKLKSIVGSVEDGTMPLPSFTWMHVKAKLSNEEKVLIINWATKTRDSLSLNK
ncbi:heme-binding domain-containing protein [Daejeonella oryzae]|uniref:heme-binding domain-containing protein n=1 Tax=Daejeonella oryzae TaxID=1122943 RepID=UPI00047E9EE7|nr:heme-binding domain-containing protein [Daejeonella oryzae]